MNRLHRFASSLLVLLASQVAFASDPLADQAQVKARDVAAKLVHIDGRIYQVTSSTRLEWESGESFTLESLEMPSEPNEVGIWPLYFARYDAVEGKNGLVLNELILLRNAE